MLYMSNNIDFSNNKPQCDCLVHQVNVIAHRVNVHGACIWKILIILKYFAGNELFAGNKL